MSPPEPLRRFACIGDVHCEDRRLEATLGFLEHEELDAVLCVGDIADGTGDVDRCCSLLAEAGVLCVAGNHDRWLIAGTMRSLPQATLSLSAQSRAWLESLPPTRTFETVVGRLMLCHGVGVDDMAVLRPDTRGYGLQAVLGHIRQQTDLSVVLGGHTHERMVRSLGPFSFVNAGTLHRDFEPGFLVADLSHRELRFHAVAEDGTVTLADVHALPGAD